MSDRRSSSLFQLLLLGGLAGLASGGVQAQTFSLVDSSYALTNNLYGSVFGTYRGSVGPLVRLQHTADSTTLQAYDRLGAPQWGMAIVTDPGVAFGVSYPDPWSVAGLSDGGFILAHWRNWTEFGPSSSFDSTMVRVNVSRFDAAGNVIYSKLLAIAIPELFNSGPVSLRVEPEGTSGGAYVLVLPGGFDSLSDLVYVHRMAPNGDLLWSRWIGHVSSWPGAHPEFVDLQSWEDLETSTAPNGDLIIHHLKPTGENTATDLFRLDTTGNVVLADRYDYASGGIALYALDHATNDAGEIFVGGLIVLSTLEERYLIFKLNATGGLVHAEFNQVYEFTQDSHLDVLSDGSVLAQLKPEYTLPLKENMLLRTSLVGPTSELWTEVKATDQTHNYWNNSPFQSLDRDSLTVFGTWTRQDQLLGSMETGIALARFPVTAPPVCDWIDSLVTRMDIPLSQIQVTDLLPSFAAWNVDLDWTIMDDTTATTYYPIPVVDLVDRCDYLTAVPERSLSLERLQVFPSPIDGHGTLHIRNATAGQVRILDAQGRAVRTYRNTVDRALASFPLDGLSRGLYLVEARDGAGLPTGVARLVVQ